MVIYKKIHHEKDPVIHKSGFPWFMSCQGFFCCVWAHVCNKPNSLIWLSQNCPILRNFCPPIDTEKLLETSFAGSLQGLNRKSLVYKKEKTKELTNSEDLGWVDFRVFFFVTGRFLGNEQISSYWMIIFDTKWSRAKGRNKLRVEHELPID